LLPFMSPDYKSVLYLSALLVITVVLRTEIYGFNEIPAHDVEDNITKAFTSKIKFDPKINIC